MKVLTVDFETFYSREFSLTKLTTEEYIRHPDFEVIGVSVQVDSDEPVWFSGTRKETKEFLESFDFGNNLALAHNAMFDAAILNWIFDIRPKGWLDTLSMARALHGTEVGGSLATLAQHYELGAKGTEVVNAMGKRRADFNAQDLARYGDYCRNDVALTWLLFNAMSAEFPKVELRLIDLTIRMFSEPVLQLWQGLLLGYYKQVVKAKQDLLDTVTADREQLMSNPKLAEALTMLGVKPPMKISPTTGKETYAFAKNDEEFKALLQHPNLKVQALAAARLGVKSTLEETRTQRFIDIAGRGPMPVPLRYYAAHTGRWGGDDKLNLQNLPRKSGLKKSIIPPSGYVILDSDSSQIEARTLAWLAEQEDLVQFFELNNQEIAEGVPKKDMQYDPYKIMAAAIYGKSVRDITDDERFVGKQTVLGCGYGMGAKKFQAQLKTYNVSMDEAECQRIINVYRETYPKIPEFWKRAQTILDSIIGDNADYFGRGNILCVEGKKGIQLPNGLYMKYPNLRKRADPESGKTEYVYDTKKGKTTVPNRIYGGKCLAADTEVLTQRGWVRITEVKLVDRVWDGVEWVKHCGLTSQGEKSTIILNGVRMTPDHKVLTVEGWRDASSCEGLHGADFWMPDGSKVHGRDKTFYLGVPLHLRKICSSYRSKRGEIRTAWGNTIMRLRGWGKKQVARYVKTPSVLGVAVNAGPLSLAITSGLAQLWRTGDQCVQSVAGILRKLLEGHGGYVCAGIDTRPQRQQWGLHTGKLPLGNSRSAGAKHALRVTSKSEKGNRINRRPTFNSFIPVAPEPVYDILNAGPRSRFLVRGIEGPFLVHNCVENVCQALARIVIGEQMLMVAKKYRVVMTVHDAIACIAPEDEATRAKEYVELCMRMRPQWAPELPLNCESGYGKSYADC